MGVLLLLGSSLLEEEEINFKRRHTHTHFTLCRRCIFSVPERIGARDEDALGRETFGIIFNDKLGQFYIRN